MAACSPTKFVALGIGASSLVVLGVLGALGAKAGGAPVTAAVVRVTFWGFLAMIVTAGIGRLFGTVV